MKNKRIAPFLCIAFVLTATSCSSSEANSNQTAGGTVDTIDFNNEIDKEDNANPQSDSIPSQTDNAQSQPDNEQPQSNTELNGCIESIGDNSVVINQIVTGEEDNVAIIYEDSDKLLINVRFSEETEFEVWTVKNGGINGDADTEKRQGAFSDLEKDATIHMVGSYEGEDFHAKQVIIYNFV